MTILRLAQSPDRLSDFDDQYVIRCVSTQGGAFGVRDETAPYLEGHILPKNKRDVNSQNRQKIISRCHLKADNIFIFAVLERRLLQLRETEVSFIFKNNF